MKKIFVILVFALMLSGCIEVALVENDMVISKIELRDINAMTKYKVYISDDSNLIDSAIYYTDQEFIPGDRLQIITIED